jgi:hypothetical protein
MGNQGKIGERRKGRGEEKPMGWWQIEWGGVD